MVRVHQSEKIYMFWPPSSNLRSLLHRKMAFKVRFRPMSSVSSGSMLKIHSPTPRQDHLHKDAYYLLHIQHETGNYIFTKGKVLRWKVHSYIWLSQKKAIC